MKVTIGLALLLVAQQAFAIKPNRAYNRTPATIGISYNSVNIPTANHQRLTAWLCRTPKGKPSATIILASMDAGNMSDNLDLVQAVTSNVGCDVLLFDYRGFGTSDKITIDTDTIALPEFVQDLQNVVEFCSTRNRTDSTKLVIWGRSMGASLGISVASNSKLVDGIVAESPYASQKSLQKYYTKWNK
jgi:alpha-beta hydrolase superfamily lysophospholipase